MPLADFTVDTTYEDIPRQVRIVVYDDLRGLRIAAARHDNRTRPARHKRRGEFTDTLGICHRYEWQNHDGESHPLCATVRLAAEHTGIGIVSHELAHATVWIRELHHDEPGPPLTCADDEAFAWTLGDLVSKTVNALWDHGIYDGTR
jgi:hypothetical protein